MLEVDGALVYAEYKEYMDCESFKGCAEYEV